MDSKMEALVKAARETGGAALVLISPDNKAVTAVGGAIDEGIVNRVFLIGDTTRIESLDTLKGLSADRYEILGACSEAEACRTGIREIKSGNAQMIMKGEINTAVFLKSVLDKSEGLPSTRRLSLVCIFEIPGLDRLVILSDPGINPRLFSADSPESGLDIIENAVDVARSIGIDVPKVAILGANELPSPSVPSSLRAQSLSRMAWKDMKVSGPLSYDIALYPQFAKKKGMADDPVAGRADLLIAPDIVSGNVIYKSWIATIGGTVANVVPGAQVPLIISSRSDTDRSKFLTICSSVLFSRYIESTRKEQP
jgi:phosphate butyryltransferase